MKYPMPSRLEFRRWRYVRNRKEWVAQAKIANLGYRTWSGGTHNVYGQIREMVLMHIGWF